MTASVTPIRRSHNARVEALALSIAHKYGMLLTIPNVATELHRSEKALRFAFSSWRCQDTPWVQALLASKIKMGRRVFFPADAVAAVMLRGDGIRPPRHPSDIGVG